MTIVTQYVDGYQRIVQVSELLGGHEDFFTTGDGDFFTCCVNGNCSCNSLDYALAHLTSNVLINITTDATLSSIAKVSDLENVSIIGQNKPTVNCRKVGGMHFKFCHNCIIKGIIWDGFGSKAKPGLKLSYSSNIIIQNCYFQHSIGQAVVLLEVTGNVNINHCQFVYNSHYRGHGAAVHYSSSNVTNHLQPLLSISNCNFTNNAHAKSLVYIGNRISEHADNVMLYYSKFCHNQGTSIYVINQKLSLSGNVLFQNNTAKSGTGIYVTDHSTVIFGKNSNVAFIQNFAGHNGGAIFASDHSTILFDQNSKLKFSYNKATRGTIYTKTNSNVTFRGTCIVEFNNNTATEYGAAIYSFSNSHVTFTNNSKVTFSGNLVYSKSSYVDIVFYDGFIFDKYYGGIVYSEYYGHISLKDNSSTVFSNNHGGAIYCWYNSHISFEDNSSTIFDNNDADNDGGAIYSFYDSNISFEDNSSTIFDNNDADKDGGAIYSCYDSHISFEDNSSTIFDNNDADNDGGAIYSCYDSHISFEDNSFTIFDNNDGGAIHSYTNSDISFEDNSSVIFNNNNNAKYDYGGGAICSWIKSHISFEGNTSTIFDNNNADDYGGAIYSCDNSSISFEDNSSTIFGNNTATSGGAIYSCYYSQISFEDNSSAIFGNNTAEDCGAIRSYHIYFKDNSSTIFVYNTAVALGGGAICSTASTETSFDEYPITNTHISFEDNSSTVFGNNTAEDHGGAIYSSFNSHISFEDNSFTIFGNNTAGDDGGAIFSDYNGHISFENNSSTVFGNNTAGDHGGAIFSDDNGHISFEDNSFTIFSNNAADYGGAISTNDAQIISFLDNSSTIFSINTADYEGGAIHFAYHSHISFSEFSSTKFNNNTAEYGGAICFLDSDLNIAFEEYSATEFNNNIATHNGGAIYCYTSNVSFSEYSTVIFRNNIADYGGAVFAEINSDITFSDNSTILFTTNRATFGATVYSRGNSKIMTRENFAIIFNDRSAKWCTNTCLPYTGQSDVVTIDGDGIVWCSNQKAFVCLSIKCYCKNLKDSLNDPTAAIVNITDEVMILSSFIELRLENNSFSLIGHNNLTVICVNGGRLSVTFPQSYHKLTAIIESINWIGCGGYRNISRPVILVLVQDNSRSDIKIQKCSFQHLMAPAIGTLLHSYWGINIAINHCSFMNNNLYGGYGVAIHYTLSSINTITVHNCNFSFNHGASLIYIINENMIYITNSSFYNNQGVPIDLKNHVKLHIHGKVSFENNVVDNGAGIYISDHSTITFGENSTVKFNNNTAINGTIYAKASSKMTFKANCEVTFSNNLATQYGSAIYSIDNSHVTLTGNSVVTFSNNDVSLSKSNVDHQFGGTIFSEKNGYVSFEENTTAMFYNNIANFGAAIFSFHNSNILFKNKSRVIFNDNIARTCGTLASALYSSVTFNDNAEVTYNNNAVLCVTSRYFEPFAGAICTFKGTDIIFSGHSFITFINNTAERGGAVAFSESNVIMQQYSTIIFNKNAALYSSGGAFVCSNHSNVTIKGNSNLTFNRNKANQNGGAIHSYNICHIIFKENSISKFVNNSARSNGGAIFSIQPSKIFIEGNSEVIFDSNTADNGGTFYFTNSTITFNETSMISFFNNKAIQSGGVGYFRLNSKVLCEGNTAVRFENNRALYGGAILAKDQSNIILTGNSNVSFVNNEATQNGGAGYFYSHCNFIVKENSWVSFTNNKALHGGAVCIDDEVKLIFKENPTAMFYINSVTVGGGAINVLNNSSIILKDFININFTKNTAQYGGAIFLDTTAVMVKNHDLKCIDFQSNFAKFSGDSVYQDVTGSCNISCLNNRIYGISNDLIATPPNVLKFYDPAICIDNDSDTQCNTYYVQNVMLGSEIILPACVLDYYSNQIIDSTQFLVHSEMHSNYFTNGPNEILISCDKFQGISIMSNQSLSTSINFSINISLNVDHDATWKQISVMLIVGLSPCHPGFWQYLESQKCECYNANDIVFCSGNSSTIKRGYWFGSVTGKPTITFCPINYCNFTCCETTNGYYHLSPMRNDQCRSHRSGTACGSCTHGYTLSFDSTKCINVESCSVSQTVLVIMLTVIYWILMVILLFAMMYYRVEIGYLYSITYYYSIVDILLSQNLQASSGLYLMVNIMSSFSKITPQFLGELCLTSGMSGIDQQFIHYIHPSAALVTFVVIRLLARKSQIGLAVISRGIIRVICLLLLLSYTSIVSTSLLLIRTLKFRGIDKVYTYLSPDVEYFHGRHLAYAIIALLCTITIVIGLPLLLIVKPFINHKIKFKRIKPLLDQFQGCYKDKFCCFAGYYMICRLVIITIVIVNSSNDFVAVYMLTIISGVTAVIHQIMKPYNNNILNKFDGITLQSIIFITALPLFSDDLNSPLAITLAYVLIFFPLLSFITMTLFLHKDYFKKLIIHFKFKDRSLRNFNNINNTDVNNNHVPNRMFDSIIDDSVRVNVTVCDM